VFIISTKAWHLIINTLWCKITTYQESDDQITAKKEKARRMIALYLPIYKRCPPYAKGKRARGQARIAGYHTLAENREGAPASTEAMG